MKINAIFTVPITIMIITITIIINNDKKMEFGGLHQITIYFSLNLYKMKFIDCQN